MRFLLPALVALSTSAFASSYFPSAPGTTWKLSNGEVQKLLQPSTIRGVKITPLQHTVNGKLVSEDLLEFRGNAVFLRGTRQNGRLTWYDAPLTIYPASPLAPGQAWSSSAAGLTLNSRVMGTEPVTTSAGRFNALVIRNDVTTASGASSTTYSYFVPGVGTVRYMSGNGSTVDLIR